MNKLFENVPELMLREDEYLDEETGLICCKHCNSPRQKELDLGDRKMKVRCLCICETIRQEIAKGDMYKQEFRDKVARNRSVGLAEPTLRQYTFANDKGYNPEIGKAKKYVEHWDEMQRDSTGLLFWGNVGTGKTFIAACIANALIDRGVPVMMTNFSRVLSDLPGLFSGDRNRYIDSFNRYPLLIIDDLGVERSSEFALEQVFNIIDGRYRAKLPLIVTTNLTLQELKNPDSLAKARIYDRVMERCVPVRINNRNIRQENARAAMERAKELLV